jgi:hypothetical protein
VTLARFWARHAKPRFCLARSRERPDVIQWSPMMMDDQAEALAIRCCLSSDKWSNIFRPQLLLLLFLLFLLSLSLLYLMKGHWFLLIGLFFMKTKFRCCAAVCCLLQKQKSQNRRHQTVAARAQIKQKVSAGTTFLNFFIVPYFKSFHF